MSTVGIVTLFLLVGLIAGVLLAILARLSVRPDGMLRGHRVTAHTLQPDDQTIHGVLVHETADRFVLVDASYVTPHGEDPIPDRVVIFKTQVSWLQEHGTQEAPKSRARELLNRRADLRLPT